MRNSPSSPIMMSRRTFRLALAVTTFVMVLHFRFVSSCSCRPSHPQQQFCTNDFALLVKVKSIVSNDTERTTVGYHVAIKKMYKMTDKVSIALKSKILWTYREESMCGVKLKENMKYLVTGRFSGNKAWLSLCNFHQPWNSLSTKQRKGFKLLYKQGCECKINFSYCQKENADNCPRNHNTCLWDTWRDGSDDCQRLHSVCMPQANGQCDWNKSRIYRTCLKERKQKKEQKERMERKQQERRQKQKQREP